MGFGGSGGGSSAISGASDAALNNPANNEVLTYNSQQGKWRNAAPTASSSNVVMLSESEYAALSNVNPAVLYVIFPDDDNWLVRDDFTATENPPVQTDTGQTYVSTGTWTSGGGNLTATADAALITVDVGATTQTVEAIWGSPWIDSSFPSFVVLYASEGTHYRVQRGSTGSSTIAINRRGGSGDANNLYVTPTNSVKAGDKVRVAVTRATGNTQFRIWVNGTQVGTYTDTASNPPNGTRAGFRFGGTGSFVYKAFRADAKVVEP